MPDQGFLLRMLLYGAVISAVLVALVLFQFYRREREPFWLVWSLAFALVAGRYVLPAHSLDTEGWSNLGVLYGSALHGLLMLWGVALFIGYRVSARWLLLPLIVALWLWLASSQGWGFTLRSLPISVLAAAGYLAMGWCFLRNEPEYRWSGHRLFFSACLLQGLHLLNYPFLRDTGFAPWGFAVAQLLHYLMAAALMVIWVRQEEHRARLAWEVQEKALRRVLRSRRRVVQLRDWTDGLLSQISDGVVVVDMDGTVVSFNTGAERIFGYPASEVRNQAVEQLMPDELRAGFRQALESIRSGADTGLLSAQPREFQGLRKDGEVFPVEITVSDLSLDENRQLVAIIRDVSERHRQEERLNYLADHDGLTGLPNRRCFEHQSKTRLGDSDIAWLAFLDLDDFKLINDTLGHKAGDAALVAMSRRLVGAAGKQALVARYSGDEFVIFRSAEPGQSADEWLETLIGAVRQPVAFNGIEFMLSGSIGLARAPENGQDMAELVRLADMAMYHAKRAGKNKYSHYHPAMLEEVNRTADIATRLKKLDPDKELRLVFQPRMRMEDRQLCGAEVLLRWQTLDGQDIPPDRFIPVAEETGQILRIGYWVMEHSCRSLAAWPQLDEPLVLSINLSARQLFDEKLVDRIEEIRSRYNLAAAQLEFEITESSAMQDLDYAIRMLGRLRALGYGLSLDDFGTGFSSLSHLRRLPVDTVKIDRSFIIGMDTDRQDRVLVASIIELAGHLGLRALAEGVETRGQLELLDSLGCDEVQGFLVARPLPEAEFLDQVLNDWERLEDAL